MWLAALALPAVWGALRYDSDHSHFIDWHGVHWFTPGEVARLRGQFMFTGDGKLYVTVHNDTELTLHRLRVRVRWSDASGPVDQTYEIPCDVAPHADQRQWQDALFRPEVREPWRAEIVSATGTRRRW